MCETSTNLASLMLIPHAYAPPNGWIFCFPVWSLELKLPFDLSSAFLPIRWRWWTALLPIGPARTPTRSSMAGRPMWTWPTWGLNLAWCSQVNSASFSLEALFVLHYFSEEQPCNQAAHQNGSYSFCILFCFAGFAFGVPQIHPAFIQRPYG